MRAALALALGALFACAAPRARVPVPLRPEHQEPELITVVHTVKPGETLYRIAKAYELSVEELMAANGISDPRSLAVGPALLIPGASEVRPVEVAPRGGEAQPEPEEALPERPPPPPHPPGAAEAGPKRGGAQKATLDWPLRGVLYGRFGKKGSEPHDGIDLAAPEGTPVKTAAEGQVLYAGEQRGYGLIVIVEHSPELVTLYAHNRDLRVKNGQRVRRGQVIATVGESGKTSGPHLHFEVREGGAPVDPLPLLGPVPPP